MTAIIDNAHVAREASRRRTFAIISHPDAGKTTLTEKLLLYAGAVVEAGSVTNRRGRRATSDWMDLEQRRGISVTSTVLRFEYEDVVFNLLDTPGHRDFSEDTLRVLAAVDAAVILIDAARGVEPQTEQLFQVARARGIPLIAFVNKYDRPGMEPLGMLDHLTESLGLPLAPLTWPVGIPGDFRGVIDRRDESFHRFTRVTGGSAIALEDVVAARGQADPADAAAWAVAEEELELVDELGSAFDAEAFTRGASIPLLFGSAAWNFGVGMLLDTLRELAPPACARAIDDGTLRPVDEPFAALAFKVQANMDPRHRDRVAFLRVCSGRFERGMRVTNARTGRGLALSFAHEVFGQDRAVLDEAFPGDVVGVVIGGDVRVGDTLYVGPPVRFSGIPTLTPESFVTVSNRDVSRHKQFRRGLEQLDQEGVVHVLRREHTQDPVPVLAGVGPMQFEVAVERLRTEFGATVSTQLLPWKTARRTDDAGAGVVLADAAHSDVLVRGDGTRLAVFPNRFVLDGFAQRHPTVLLERLIGADEPQ